MSELGEQDQELFDLIKATNPITKAVLIKTLKAVNEEIEDE